MELLPVIRWSADLTHVCLNTAAGPLWLAVQWQGVVARVAVDGTTYRVGDSAAYRGK